MALLHVRLRQLRRERKLTLKQLSVLSGIPVPTLSRIEKNPDENVGLRIFRVLASTFEVSMDYLDGRTANRTSHLPPEDRPVFFRS